MMPPFSQSDHITGDATGFYTEIADAKDYYGSTILHHTVSKFDTLPGLAIKYGVEVSEIKKVNGLVTDSQMFGLPSLRIPLPGRHPTSYSTVCNSASNIDLLTPSRQKISSNMSNLQQFYGLNSPTLNNFYTGKEVGGCKTSKLNEKSRTAGNGSRKENGLNSSYLLLMEPLVAKGSVDSDQHQWLESELDFGRENPENVLIIENEASRGSSFYSRTRKGLSLRPKSAGRGSQASHDSEWSISSSNSGDSSIANAPVNSNKSYSYYDQEENTFSKFWSNTKLKIKTDMLNLAMSTLTKPLLECPPIVTSNLKVALD